MAEIRISLRERKAYLKNSVDLKMDKNWQREVLGEVAHQKGVYVIFYPPRRVLYVGKTRGQKMDLAKRLYRHVHKKASSNSKVYRVLRRITRKEHKPIKVSLIDGEVAKSHFTSNIEIEINEPAAIDILEQILIHYLRPKIQTNDKETK